MSASRYCAWGHKPASTPLVTRPAWSSETAKALSSPEINSVLPFGNGRSYGDSCLNSAGKLVDAGALDRFIEFDENQGVLTAEAGVLLNSVISVAVPRGWFLPVTPGTSFVTLGGAVANDVHGKNHHRDGTIGRFIKSFTLLRSDGETIVCSESQNQALFRATIGGLGLTGFIVKVTLQLIPIQSSDMEVRIDAFQGLQEFGELSTARKHEYQYTVAWMDCASSGALFARGIFLSANHSRSGELGVAPTGRKISIPFAFPAWLLNAYSIKSFNRLYYHRLSKQHGQQLTQNYRPYFYPLDAVGNWNRVYGAGGFYQYQFVVPLNCMAALESILRDIVGSGLGSFLAVLKEFGDIESPGMLSFPREGYCLALDFANRGKKTEQLISRLDDQVMECGGAAYPAKDKLMSAKAFSQYFPKLVEFESYIDPKFSSDFWERVRG